MDPVRIDGITVSVISKQRTDHDWISDLSVHSQDREVALADLRCALLSGLNRALCQNPIVEDCAQEALLRILDRLESFRGESRFLTWAMAIALRIAFTEMRRARWKDRSLDEMVDAGKLVSVGTSVMGSPMLKQLTELMTETIEKDLTEKQRTAIQAELGGLPPDEIARRMGTNRNAIYKLIYDARVKLKVVILKKGWSEEKVRLHLGDC